jgi:hypothetical protein
MEYYLRNFSRKMALATVFAGTVDISEKYKKFYFF